MQIDLNVQLMPNHLPGRAVAAFSRVEMLPTPEGGVVLVATDADDHLAVWVSAGASYTRWTQVPFKLGDGNRPLVLDFDVVASADGHAFDLAVVVIAERDHATYIFHAVPASADADAWAERFAGATPVPLPFAPAGASWSKSWPAQPEGPRALAMRGTRDDGHPGAWWLRFHHDGGLHAAQAMSIPDTVHSAEQLLLMAANQRVDGALVAGCFMVAPSSDARRRTVSFLVPATGTSPERVWPQRFVDGTYDGWGPVSDMCAAPWPETGVTIPYFNVSSGLGDESLVCFFNDTAVIDGEPVSIATSSLDGYRPVAGLIHADIEIEDGHHVDHRFELVAPVKGDIEASLLRMSIGSEANDDLTTSTLIAADVAAFCACRCVDPRTLQDTRHVLVGYRDGGVELYTLEPVSGLWQRYVLADDRLDAIHETSSYTLRVRPLDDGDGPLARGALAVTAFTPCTATVQGRTFHLNSLVPAVIALGPGNDVGIVLSLGTLASPTLELALFPDVVIEPSDTLPVLSPSVLDGHSAEVSAKVTPSDLPMDELALLADGDAIRNAVASDGSQPFKDLSPDTCHAAYVGVVSLVSGYRAAQRGVVPGERQVITRLRFEGGRGEVRCTPVAMDVPLRGPVRVVPRGPHDVLDDFGNLLAYLWNADGPVDFFLDLVADGSLQLVVWLGDEYVSLVAESAEAVAESTDWFLQHTLGVGLDDIVNWLGFVFDWDAILRNKDALARVSELAMDFLHSQLVHGEAAVKDTARYLRSQIAEFPELSPDMREILAQDPQKRPSSDSPLDHKSSDPSAQWGLQTMRSYGGASSVDMTGDRFGFVSAVEQIFIDQGIVLADLADELVAYFESGGVADRTLLQIFEDVLALTTETAVDAGEVMALGTLTVVEALLEALDATLDERIHLPVITTLYETVLVPGGTLTIRDATLLAASIVMTVGHKLAFGVDLFTAEQLATIDTVDSLPALVHALEAPASGRAGAAGTRRLAVGGVVGGISSTFKAVYVLFWSLDAWFDYAPGQIKLMSLNLPKVACDGVSWGLSLSWAVYRNTLTYDSPHEAFAASANLMAVGTTTFNRVKDAIETSAMLQGRGVPSGTSNKLRAGEAFVAGAGLLVCDVLFLEGLVQVPIEDCPPEIWRALVALPVVQLADSGVYSLLALESFVESPTTRIQLRMIRTGANILRPVLGYATASLKIVAAGSGYRYPGSAAE